MVTLFSDVCMKTNYRSESEVMNKWLFHEQLAFRKSANLKQSVAVISIFSKENFILVRCRAVPPLTVL